MTDQTRKTGLCIEGIGTPDERLRPVAKVPAIRLGQSLRTERAPFVEDRPPEPNEGRVYGVSVLVHTEDYRRWFALVCFPESGFEAASNVPFHIAQAVAEAWRREGATVFYGDPSDVEGAHHGRH